MNEATWMMVVVSGGFAALAVLGAVWSLATGQWKTRHEGSRIPLEDDRDPRAAIREG